MVARGRHPQAVALRKRYDEFVEAQGGEFCFLCGATPKTRRLHIDHDHKTGEVRGLLCHVCNRFLRSDPLWHDRAAMYLRKPPIGLQP